MSIFKKILRKIIFLTTLKKRLLFCSLSILVFSLPFLSGAINPKTNNECYAEYVAQIAKRSGPNSVVPLIVEPKDYNTHKVISTDLELLYLYGLFGKNKISFVGSVNADKTHEIKLKHKDKVDSFFDINFSFIYIERAGFRNYFDKNQNVWIQEQYPLKLMFEGISDAGDCYSFFYISQSQADAILEESDLPKTEANYESLIGSKHVISFDGTEIQWVIGNIYYDWDDDPFYSIVSRSVGNFFLGYNKYPDGFKKQSVYFLGTHAYENKYYIDYANNLYSSDYFFYKTCIDGKYAYSISYPVGFAPSTNAFSIIIILTNAILLFSLLFLIIISKYFSRLFNIFIVFVSSLFPFITFKVLFMITGNVFFFSGVGTISYFAFLLVFIFVVFLTTITNKLRLKS